MTTRYLGTALIAIWIVLLGFYLSVIPSDSVIAEDITDYQWETEMLDHINLYRAQMGVAPVTNNVLLASLARSRSQDMAARKYLSHVTPEGTTIFTLLQASGLDGALVGEIIGRTNGPTSQSAGMVMNGFIHSLPHRDSMLRSDFTWAGVGFATSAEGIKYYTVIFL